MQRNGGVRNHGLRAIRHLSSQRGGGSLREGDAGKPGNPIADRAPDIDRAVTLIEALLVGLTRHSTPV